MMGCEKCGCGCNKKLCPFTFGLALGLTCAIFTAVYAWIGWAWGYGVELITQYGSVYFGYAPTFIGGLWGALWGFAEGFIFGFVLVLIFDLLMCCKKCLCKNNGCSSCGGSKK